MPRAITESITDAETPILAVYRGEDNAAHAAMTFYPVRSDGKRSEPENVDRTLGQLQAAGAITNAERLAFISTATKIRNALRTIAGLDPS